MLILNLKPRNSIVDKVHYLYCGGIVLSNALTTDKSIVFIKSGNTERCRHVVNKIPNHIVRVLSTMIQPSFAKCKRISATLCFSDKFISLLEELTNDFKTIIQFSPEVQTVLLTKLIDQRKIQRHSTDITTANSNVLLGHRITPRSQVCSASHRRSNDAVIQVRMSNDIIIRITSQGQVIWVHALLRATNAMVEYFAVLLDMFFIVQVYQLREDYLLTTMSLHANVKDGMVNHLKEFLLDGRLALVFTKRKRSKCEVTSTARNSIKLQFESLKSLMEFFVNLLERILFCRNRVFGYLLIQIFRKISEFFAVLIVGLHCIRQKHLVDFWNRKPTKLLCRSTQRNISDNLDSRKNRIRFRVFDVGHFESALKDISHIEQTAIDVVQDHVSKVMDINVSSVDQFKFSTTKIELTIEFFSSGSSNETSLSGTQRAIEVGVLFITQVQNIIGTVLDMIPRLGIGVLVVSVLLITISNLFESNGLQAMNNSNMDIASRNEIHTLIHTITKILINFVQEIIFIAVSKLIPYTISRLLHCIQDLLGIKLYNGIVFLSNFKNFILHSSSSPQHDEEPIVFVSFLS